ncbi:uncharacterized protein LOC126815177 [Patella vulgata]|uniref:uncharacterized protein LOC126815177 n=1 Tax=Patella vulgata TaxID=6465 RepID=UPI0024A7CC8A|nr:uncharacterized protein LOC126815177 [Patella vulgata]
MLTAPLILELITSRTSSLLSLVICCERFIAVFKPLKVKLWVTPKRMIFSVVAITVIVIGLLALMTIVSIYIVCLLPGSIFLALSLIDKRFSPSGEFGNEFRVASSITTFLEVFNSSANFVVYVVMNKKFSNILVQMLCGFRKKNRRNDHGVVGSNVTLSSTLG